MLLARPRGSQALVDGARERAISKKAEGRNSRTSWPKKTWSLGLDLLTPYAHWITPTACRSGSTRISSSPAAPDQLAPRRI